MASNSSPAPTGASATSAGWLSRNLTTLVLVSVSAAVLGAILKGSEDPLDDFLNICKVVFALGLVIFIHELGHFLAAKWCDVYVQTFSIGFGPPFLGLCAFKWGETDYKIGWVPLGGYVKMVGEGEDNEENADDPRSYKNKKVWQRMIIISAGVVMNLILALVCYLGVLMTHGIDQNPGVVGFVGPGGPAWKKGLRPGSMIRQIGEKQDPFYEELQREVMRAGNTNPLDLVYESYVDGKPFRHATQITPTRSDEILAPMLLVSSSRVPVLARKGGGGIKVPAVPGSPASKAQPPFAFFDRIIGATDPASPGQVTPLRTDPRRGDGGPDYYDLERRMQFLLGQSMTFRIERSGTATPVDIRVEPAFARTVGMRMMMGPIVAVRDESPAVAAGIQPREGKDGGDTLQVVEFTHADGTKVRYSADPKANELPLDPMRLPTQLALWAASKPSDYTVRLTVLRPEGHKQVEKTLTAKWDADWELLERPPSPTSFLGTDLPMPLGGLGIAYAVLSKVAGVELGSPAEAAGLKAGDKITAMSAKLELPNNKSETIKREPKEEGWAYYGSFIHETELLAELEFTVNDGQQIKLTPREDRTLPLLDRGLLFEQERRSLKADGFLDALQLSAKRVVIKMMTIYENLAGMIRGRLSPKAISGPITIAKHSFDLAGRDTFEFILFIALININLAVVNFLPIPVLDGGHMVFLIYELLRGKPPSDRWRFILTIIGLVVVLGLMVFGLVLDFGRWLLEPLKRFLGM